MSNKKPLSYYALPVGFLAILLILAIVWTLNQSVGLSKDTTKIVLDPEEWVGGGDVAFFIVKEGKDITPQIKNFNFSNVLGQEAIAAADLGGDCYVSYAGNGATNCISGFVSKGKIGDITRCAHYYGSADSFFMFDNASGTNCMTHGGSWYQDYGDAILCCAQ